MARASVSRSRPMTVSFGNRSRNARLWPPMPSVASTRTAPSASMAGASSSTVRSSMTGVWMRSMSMIPSGPVPGLRSPSVRPGAGKCIRRTAGSRNPGLEQPGDHLLRRLREGRLLLGEVCLPCLGIPDLHPAAGADDCEVSVQPRIAAERGGDGDPMLLVGGLRGCPREEDAHVVARLLARHGGLADLVAHLLELPCAEHVDAALLPAREHEAGRELLPELRRKNDATLLIELRFVGSEEHRATPFPPARIQVTPLYSTLIHRSTTFARFRARCGVRSL